MMRVATALLSFVLSGCLYVWTTGDGGTPEGELGIKYDCVWRHNGVNRHERVCGPLVQDPDYVIAHFPFDREGEDLICTASADFCYWTPE